MSSLIVEILPIEEIQTHPNADRLELARIKGWWCAVPKDQYKVNDIVVYIPPDAVLPVELSDKIGVTKYLSNGRVKTSKLRGSYSQGIIVSPETLQISNYTIGEDVQELLGIIKYEPPFLPSTMGGIEIRCPSGFVQYTDIEHYKNYPNVLTSGEEVVISEKLHGCLPFLIKIKMADGTIKPIHKINVGDCVLGYDNGKIKPAKVLKTYKNGKCKKWLTVQGKRCGVGKGNAFFSLHCTPNHQLYDPELNIYRDASSFKVGDSILMLRSDTSLTPVQYQVLLGKLLGDGYLYIPNSKSRDIACVQFGHKVDHLGYLDWTVQSLGDIGVPSYHDYRISGYGSKMVRSHTVFLPSIKESFSSFYHDGKKHIPEWIVDQLGPISMAFWYMDDGSLGHHSSQEDRVLFAVCSYNENDCDLLLKALKKFNINGTYYVSNNISKDGKKINHSRIRLNADEAEKFFLLIAPYIPPVMQYKLPERYRGHLGWIPKQENYYKPLLVKNKIDTIFEDSKVKSTKYDIETETHNFFATNILVHNSNFRAGKFDDIFYVGSHRRALKEDDSILYWKAAKLYDLKSILPNNSVFFGEVFGKGVQKLHYDRKRIDIAFYDMIVEGRYLNWSEFGYFVTHNNLPSVPILFQGPWDTSLLTYATGPSAIAKHIKEGIVVNPVVERFDLTIGRVILKYISESYLLKSYGDLH